MLTHIRVKNFKSWADSGEVALAPLTGFFGTNSSGKSSLLQMLLLLKQTIGREAVLFFGDESSLVNLGSFRDVIHRHDTDASLELEFGCNLRQPGEIRILGRDTDWWKIQNLQISVDIFTFTTSIRQKQHSLRVASIRYSLDSGDVPEVRWGNGRWSYRDLFGKQPSWREQVSDCYGGSVSEDGVNPLASAFERQFSHVYYLGPARVTPQRCYHWEGTHPQNTGLWGDKAIDALLSARVKRLKTHYQGEHRQIEEQVSAWLQSMELASAFSLEPSNNGDGRDYEVRIKKDSVSPAVTLVDMGYGLSQFLPVLVFCYYAPEGSTLILEQPGMHLHPKVQSQLADLLIEVVTERNLQVLVESHSEHLLNRLQRRIAEEQISVDKTALYFCRNNGGVSACERLEMDEFGNIANWPENFFGDEMGDLLAMAQAQMERQKRAEA